MRLERLRPKYAGVRMRQVRAGRPLTCVPDEIPHLWAAAAVALASAPRERGLHDACVACLSTRSFRHVTAARSNAMPSSTRVDSFRCIRVHPTMAPMWLRCGWVRASHHQPHGLALEQGSKGPHVRPGSASSSAVAQLSDDWPIQLSGTTLVGWWCRLRCSSRCRRAARRTACRLCSPARLLGARGPTVSPSVRGRPLCV